MHARMQSLMRCVLDVAAFQLLQQMTRPHIDSFNYMLTTGLSDAVKVCA